MFVRPLLTVLLGAGCLLAAIPAMAAATGYRLPVASAGVTGTFWVTPPLEGRYTCPMDPDVHASAPGVCPKCQMDLELARTKLRLQVAGMAGRKVRMGVVGAPTMSTVAVFDKADTAEAGFMLPPGHYTFTADMGRPHGGRTAHFSAPYLLR